MELNRLCGLIGLLSSSKEYLLFVWAVAFSTCSWCPNDLGQVGMTAAGGTPSGHPLACGLVLVGGLHSSLLLVLLGLRDLDVLRGGGGGRGVPRSMAVVLLCRYNELELQGLRKCG